MAKQKLPDIDAQALDQPVWSALTTTHERLAVGTDAVRRYPADVSQLTAFSGDIREHAQVLRILASDGPLTVLSIAPVDPIAGLQIHMQSGVDQMIASSDGALAASTHVEVLDQSDVLDMLTLAALAKPGAFLPKTSEIGMYVGIRDGNRLVAVAGERLRMKRFTEISSVCVHPSYRGRGMARALISRLVTQILKRGEQPLAHPLQADPQLIGLYLGLGFERRRTFRMTCFHYRPQFGEANSNA